MKTCFCSIVLNEQEFLYQNLLQHYSLCDEWIIVEGCCKDYPTHNVTSEGLSGDATAEIIKSFPDPDNKIKFIQYGFTEKDGEHGKSELRNQYAARIEETCVVVVIDADEFYLQAQLKEIIKVMKSGLYSCWRIPQLHFWRDLEHIIVGGYFNVPHNRVYNWRAPLLYEGNHNHPEFPGGPYRKSDRSLNLTRKGASISVPHCFHLGFAKGSDNMRDKTDYYLNRGEKATRPETSQCREAWFNGRLPLQCEVLSWAGDLPEVFRGVE